VFRLIYLVPVATAFSNARRALSFFSKIVSALAVHLNGFGSVLRSATQASMAAMSSSTKCVHLWNSGRPKYRPRAFYDWPTTARAVPACLPRP
jgi:hypothetical protein